MCNLRKISTIIGTVCEIALESVPKRYYAMYREASIAPVSP